MLSANGSAPAVGAPGEGSMAAGVFVPGGQGCRDALNDNRLFFVSGLGLNGLNAGAVPVCRLSDSAWSLRAIVKAPDELGGESFVNALALSRDGATLAAGSRGEGARSPACSSRAARATA